MRSFLWCVVVSLGLCVAAPTASGIILFGLDNASNLTDPGTGVPFNAVAKLSNISGTGVTGSAIHLGNGYMLTAHHVAMQTHVSFDGTTFYLRDTGFTPQQVAPNVDLQVFRLSSVPPVSSVNLLTTSSETTGSATLVGWGVGRTPSTPVDSISVPWGDTSTILKRWGVNEPEAVVTVGYQSGSYQALETVLGSATGTPPGLGASEAAATVYDSGSALFQNIFGVWYLIGVTTAVQTNGTSNFGNDQTSAPKGDSNYFARVSAYDTQINAIIPEPSAVALFLLGTGAFFLKRRRDA